MKKILIVDFGASRPDKIKNKIGNCAEIIVSEAKDALDVAKNEKPDGIILGGGSDVKDINSPKVDEGIYSLGIPIYGMCSGMEYIALHYGAKVGKDKYEHEKGKTLTISKENNVLFKGIPEEHFTHMFHKYSVETLPEGFEITAKTLGGPIAAFENRDKKVYGTIFHPEGRYSSHGEELLKNFVDSL